MPCGVNGCTGETYMGWAPVGEQKGRQVCEVHFRRHDDPNDSFNLWDAFGFKRPAGIGKTVRTDAEAKLGEILAALPKPKSRQSADGSMQGTVGTLPAGIDKKMSHEVQQNPSGCRACGTEREPGHTYCRTCGQKRKAESNRRRQKRHYLKTVKT